MFTYGRRTRGFIMQDTVKLFIGTSDNHDDLSSEEYIYIHFV